MNTVSAGVVRDAANSFGTFGAWCSRTTPRADLRAVDRVASCTSRRAPLGEPRLLFFAALQPRHRPRPAGDVDLTAPVHLDADKPRRNRRAEERQKREPPATAGRQRPVTTRLRLDVLGRRSCRGGGLGFGPAVAGHRNQRRVKTPDGDLRRRLHSSDDRFSSSRVDLARRVRASPRPARHRASASPLKFLFGAGTQPLLPRRQGADSIDTARPSIQFQTTRAKLQTADGLDQRAPARRKRCGWLYIAFLDAQPQVNHGEEDGTQGYCMGGALVFRTAATVPDRAGAGTRSTGWPGHRRARQPAPAGAEDSRAASTSCRLQR